MIINKKSDECCGCSACAQICPFNSIMMKEDEDGFLYPIVNEKACKGCDLCNTVCPIDNFQVLHCKPKAYGAININKDIRLKSSSGGVFYLLCKYVINNNGVVFGAAFNDSFDVFHMCSETLQGCEKFMGSKYVPSVIGESYILVKRFLKENRLVLFTGTPCQIAGLYAFLGNKADQTNLITQDIICHSVPSPTKWTEFKNYIRKNRQITEIQFRNKETGWRSGSFIAKFNDGSEYRELYAKTSFMKGFLQGQYSRPSCYKCMFSRLERQSDITLGDFWGVEGLYPKLYDNLGTSVVLLNSTKGEKIFKSISKELIKKKAKLEWAVKYNPAAAQRNALFQNMNST